MRILRIAQKLYPEVLGGGPYHVHAMSRDQAARGHDVTVLTVTEDSTLPQKEQRDGYTIVRRQPTTSVLENDISAGVAKFLRTAADFDVIHAHSHLYFSTNLAALHRRLSETPLAITNHGLYSQNAPEWLFDMYLQTAGRWTFNQADVVFCYTEEDRSRIQNLGVDSQIEVIANGVDTERFTPDGPTSEQICHEGPVVLFVGRLVEGKRPIDAIEAFAKAASKQPSAKLYFAGEGVLYKELARRATDLGVRDAVSFLGQIPYEEMPEIYRAADILVLPSRAEGLPRTVLEAMASGTPVVTSNLPQVRAVAQEGGRTVPVGETGALASAIAELFDKTVSTKLSNQGREYVRDAHQWNDTVEQTTEQLSDIVAQR